MTVTTTQTSVAVPERSPTDRMLTAALIIGPLLMLATDTLYAVEGWTDPTAGVLHVLGAIVFGLVGLRIAAWLPRDGVLSALLILTAVAGAVGNAAYGFDAIHQSVGDVSLVDREGAALLIKPVGLIFPLSLALISLGLRRLGHRSSAAITLVAAIGWPIAHIADIGWFAVVVNLLLAVALGKVAWGTRRTSVSEAEAQQTAH